MYFSCLHWRSMHDHKSVPGNFVLFLFLKFSHQQGRDMESSCLPLSGFAWCHACPACVSISIIVRVTVAPMPNPRAAGSNAVPCNRVNVMWTHTQRLKSHARCSEKGCGLAFPHAFLIVIYDMVCGYEGLWQSQRMFLWVRCRHCGIALPTPRVIYDVCTALHPLP